MSLGPVMLDIAGTSLTSADRALMREPAVGGVILFSRNYESPAQLTALVEEIRALRSPPLLIAADHEGGRVQRFREGFSPIPSMRRLGHLYDENPRAAREMAHTCGWLIGSELRAAGVDLCFAPCVDLDWGVSDVIGDRAFHKDPEIVSALAGALCRGLKEAGMAAVAKHFPGHGAVAADSHHALPVDRRSYGDVLDDMRPYEFLVGRNSIAGVMIAHIVFPEMDQAAAGFSPYWIGEQLRSQIGFDGAVFCDDLSMKATEGYGGMPQRARVALDAGCDMVLVCNDRQGAARTVASLADYSNPLSLVRLARLHGTGHILRETLLASDVWATASNTLQRWLDRPVLELDA